MSECYVLVEGESEQHFINHLKTTNIIKLCHLRILNCWEKDISRILIRIRAKATVIMIYDIDTLYNGGVKQSSAVKRFCQNIQTLVKGGFKVILLQQTNNFEDELSYACGITKKKLKCAFRAEGDRELKTNIINCKTILAELNKLGLDCTRLWQRETDGLLLDALSSKNYTKGNWRHIKK